MAVLSNNDLTFPNGGGYKLVKVKEGVTFTDYYLDTIANLKSKYTELVAVINLVPHSSSYPEYDGYKLSIVLPTQALLSSYTSTFYATRYNAANDFRVASIAIKPTGYIRAEIVESDGNLTTNFELYAR